MRRYDWAGAGLILLPYLLLALIITATIIAAWSWQP